MKKHSLFIFSALFLLSSCVPLTPIPPSESAIIGEVENDVTLKHTEKAPFEQAFVNDEIKVNAQVRTNEDSRSRVDLSSGTIIRIAPNSLFIFEENSQKEDGLFTRLKIEAGKVWIVLNGGSLEVETPSGLAGVRGSYMSTGYDPESGDVRITCLEGQCAAENESGAVAFTAGEAADLPADGAPPVKGEMTEEEYQMWADNVPEARSLLPQGCTVTGKYLNIRACPETSCEALGYAEKGDLLNAFASSEEGWLTLSYEGEEGWIKAEYCE